MTKKLMVLTIAAVAVLGFASMALASGGEAPPVNVGLAPTGKSTITGSVVMDPHMDGATTTAKYAVVTLHAKSKKIGPSSVAVKIPAGVLFTQGCSLALTETRFVYSEANPKRMRSWIPDADLFDLFAALGEPISNTDPVRDPIITAVTAQACVDIGSGVDAPSDSSFPGWLTMEFVVDFLTPGGN